MMRVKVAESFRLAHAGTVYGPGDLAEVPDHVGQDWVRQGWATEVKAAPPRKK